MRESLGDELDDKDKRKFGPEDGKLVFWKFMSGGGTSSGGTNGRRKERKRW